uniref:Large ribosomal subunit protein bL36m n=1 Tax=Panagrolaimus sp. PS1159 TaxID=55785 RepID=A0AC35FUN4_9BILA
MSLIPKLFTQTTLKQANNAFRNLLFPSQANLTQQSGFKVKTFLKLRCKYCYFIRIDGRLHVECPAIPRHKAREPFNVKQLW